MNNSVTEQDILALILQAESRQEGFVALMRLYSESLYWHIRRLVVSHEDAEDILQETFVKVHKYIERFRGDSSLKTWLFRVATNESMRHYRKHRLESQSYDEHSRLIELYESDERIDFSTLEAKLQRAILTLPPKQRVVFNLRYYDEMSYEQISEVTESNVSALKVNYHHARERIKEYMLNQMED